MVFEVTSEQQKNLKNLECNLDTPYLNEEKKLFSQEFQKIPLDVSNTSQ